MAGSGPVVVKARALADAFRHQGLPVVVVNVAGGLSADRTARSGVGTLGKRDRYHETHVGAFTATPLEQILRDRAVTQMVLAGISTGVGVESTARQTHEPDANVTLAADAMTDGGP
ncbi:isochorismatase family protein [Variovorax sp. 22077]|uniref:isochorismatase family protein n=1 Tax=Variovorax sp. 22077 TaxID=3453867 RepID=UPI003F8370F3